MLISLFLHVELMVITVVEIDKEWTELVAKI